jgi:hypothetical protein
MLVGAAIAWLVGLCHIDSAQFLIFGCKDLKVGEEVLHFDAWLLALAL